MVEKKRTAKPTKKTAATGTSSKGFTDEERAAMQERTKELAAEKRGAGKREAGERDVRAKIDEMEGSDRAIAEGLHAVVAAHAPQLAPKTWYGMPAYANADGKVVCFFQAAQKFSARYATLGFQDAAQLDDGDLWPTAYAVMAWTPAVEKRVAELAKKAAA